MNLDKLHSTELRELRIKKNLSLDSESAAEWCRTQISSDDALVTRKGKNRYVLIGNCVMTVNAYSFTIITAHRSR